MMNLSSQLRIGWLVFVCGAAGVELYAVPLAFCEILARCPARKEVGAGKRQNSICPKLDMMRFLYDVFFAARSDMYLVGINTVHVVTRSCAVAVLFPLLPSLARA